MKVKMPKTETFNARNLTGEKETICRRTVVALHKGELRNAVAVRWHTGRSQSASTVYCSVWIHAANGQSVSGHGRAGGCGYHKESAAFEAALDSAGVGLLTDDGRVAHIGGRGELAIREALEAITRAAGYRGKMIIV